jgi:N-acetylglutamate synthase-like GNAT family acetyltransferase
MKIEKAKNIDNIELSELTARSKAQWNYSSEQIEKWKDDLTISAEYIDKYEVYKLKEDDKLIGYYSFQSVDYKKVKLDNIFINPEFIGRGYGKILMNHFFKKVKSKGFENIYLDSDPNAEKFYQNLGFKVIGQLESSIKNRFLPIMELKIK